MLTNGLAVQNKWKQLDAVVRVFRQRNGKDQLKGKCFLVYCDSLYSLKHRDCFKPHWMKLVVISLAVSWSSSTVFNSSKWNLLFMIPIKCGCAWYIFVIIVFHQLLVFVIISAFAAGLSVVPAIRDSTIKEDEEVVKFQIVTNLLDSAGSKGGDSKCFI